MDSTTRRWRKRWRVGERIALCRRVEELRVLADGRLVFRDLIDVGNRTIAGCVWRIARVADAHPVDVDECPCRGDERNTGQNGQTEGGDEGMFHGDRGVVSTARRVSGHRKPGMYEFVRALSGILDTPGKKCSLAFERSNSEPVELPSDAPTALVDEMR
jgi:hypothetical protein